MNNNFMTPLANNSIYFGNTPDGEPVKLPIKDLYTHVDMNGTTGRGKTNLLLGFSIQLIEKGFGCLIIDSQGSWATNLRNYMILNRKHRDLVLLDATDPEFTLGFNLIESLRGIDPSVSASNLKELLGLFWGVTDFNATPGIDELLDYALYLLFDNQHLDLKLTDALALLDSDPNNARRNYILANSKDSQAKKELIHIIGNLKKETILIMEGAYRRISKVLQNHFIYKIFNSKNYIDPTTIMDENKVLIVNLSDSTGSLTINSQKALGSVILNSFYYASSKRVTKNPFFVICDEVYDYINIVVAKGLTKSRQKGAHYILAHQAYDQLKLIDPILLATVKGNTDTKIFLGGISNEDRTIAIQESLSPFMRFDVPESVFYSTKQLSVLKQLEVEISTETKNIIKEKNHALSLENSSIGTNSNYYKQGTKNSQSFKNSNSRNNENFENNINSERQSNCYGNSSEDIDTTSNTYSSNFCNFDEKFQDNSNSEQTDYAYGSSYTEDSENRSQRYNKHNNATLFNSKSGKKNGSRYSDESKAENGTATHLQRFNRYNKENIANIETGNKQCTKYSDENSIARDDYSDTGKDNSFSDTEKKSHNQIVNEKEQDIKTIVREQRYMLVPKTYQEIASIHYKDVNRYYEILKGFLKILPVGYMVIQSGVKPPKLVKIPLIKDFILQENTLLLAKKIMAKLVPAYSDNKNDTILNNTAKKTFNPSDKSHWINEE